jgi:hypothetical protein
VCNVAMAYVVCNVAIAYVVVCNSICCFV